MKIQRHRNFDKQYKKLPAKQQKKFDERLLLWIENPEHPILNNHQLKGNYQGYWSINVSGDVRALYAYNGETIVIFAFIGTHSQLYGG